MTDLTPSIGGPGIGLFFGSTVVTCFNRTAATLTVGQIVVLDLAQSATETTTADFGEDAAGTSNVVKVTLVKADDRFAFVGVVLDANILDNEKGQIMFRGVTDCHVGASTATNEAMGTETGLLTLTGTITNQKLVAITLEGRGSDGLAKCIFNGIEGVGQSAAVS